MLLPLHASSRSRSGLTLVEVLVVVAIMVILLSIIFVSISDARQKARDRQRLGDLAQLALALSAYHEVHRSYPDYDNGVAVGSDSMLDADLAPFLGTAVADPLGTDEFYYWYDSSFDCGGVPYVVLMARLETQAGDQDLSCVDTEERYVMPISRQ